MGQRVPTDQAEQRLRPQPGPAERAVLDPRRQVAVDVQQCRQQQAPHPHHGAGKHAGIRTGATGAAPVQAADQGRRELRHRRERQQAVLGQGLLVQRMAVVGEGDQRQQQDADAADQQHPAFDPGALVQQAASQQQRHHQVVADHGRQGHAGHDHHAGGRRQAADVGGQCQPFVAMRQRQGQHVAVGGLRGGIRQGLPGQRDRQHQHADQRQVSREHPACPLQVRRVLAFHHRHVELARQADDGQEAQQGLGQETGRQLRAVERMRAFGDACRDGARAGQLPQREHADRNEGQQLDHGLQRDRQHHAAMVLGGIDATGAEQDREHRQHQRHVQRRVGPPVRRQRLPGQHAHAHAHRLELQREVRDRGDHRQHRHRRRQPARAAIAG